MLCNENFWTLWRLCSPLLLSDSQDWGFRVIIDALDTPKIFNNFSIDYLTSFELLYLHKIRHKFSIKCVFLLT